jgi:hypothetical protein
MILLSAVSGEDAQDRSGNYTYIFYYINVQSPNLNLKLGIKPKAGNFLSRKREGEGGWGIG